MKLSNAPALDFKEAKKAHAKANTSSLLQKSAPYETLYFWEKIYDQNLGQLYRI